MLRPFDTLRDDEVVRRILALAFGGTPEGMGAYFDLAGRENMRLLDRGDGPVVACLANIPMGQYFGGRSVPMMGIAAVGVAPEARARGHARELMCASVRETAAAGIPLSCLYASTQSLYRQVGFEQAGSTFEVRIPLRQLTDGTRDLPVEPVTIDDPRLERCYREFARRYDGCLDRGPFIWKRIQQNREQMFHGFAVVPDGPGSPVEGYAFVGQVRRPENGRHDVVLSDLAFSTQRAGLRLAGFLGDYASMGWNLSFIGGACHPFLTLLSQQWVDVSMRDYWMLRICDVGAAIAARGYASSVRANVVIEVDDELIEANRGRWQIEIDDGQGRAARTNLAAQLRTNIRGLAAIYAGFLTPQQAALVGLAEGDTDAMATLAPAFTNSGPWMVDHF